MLSSKHIDESLAILEQVRTNAPLANSDMHGEQHWQAVARIGLHLAGQTTGADQRTALLFAILHDSRRKNEDYDPKHGHRAASFVDELCDAGALDLQLDEVSRLRHAVARHNDGETSVDPTIGACWDADRLCLSRVGVDPRDELLSTAAGRGGRRSARAMIQEPLGDWREMVASAEDVNQVSPHQFVADSSVKSSR